MGHAERRIAREFNLTRAETDAIVNAIDRRRPQLLILPNLAAVAMLLLGLPLLFIVGAVSLDSVGILDRLADLPGAAQTALAVIGMIAFLWLVSFIHDISGTRLLVRALRLATARRECASCGYSLRGVPDDGDCPRCPECGKPAILLRPGTDRT